MKEKEVLNVLDKTEPITKIYFIRHGQTLANESGLISGQWNVSLNKTGEKQISQAGRKLKNYLKDKKIDCIIASPLLRTMQTARILSKETGVKKIITNADLMERSEGAWEGSTYWKVKESDPENYYKWLKDPYKIRPPKGESVVDLQKRLKKFHNFIRKNYVGKNIIVSSHSGAIRAFVMNVLEMSPDKFWHMKIENGSLTEVHISKNHNLVWTLSRV